MKNKKISVILSFLFPGFGHLYIGKYIDAIVFIFGAGLLWFAIYYRNDYLFNFNNPRSLLVWGALFFIYLYAMIDVYLKAKKYEKQRPVS